MRIKCIVTYDGTHFYGWQIQPDKRTVQEEIQKAIYKITHEEVTIHSSGRTDAGVHAVGQVFHFVINKEIPEKQWIRALNNFLPEDIYIKDSFIVDESFHARYSAKKKEYRYLVSTKPYNPIERLYVYQHNRPLDIEAMRECAQIFLGEHDFASFCVFNGLGDTIRVIETIDIQEEDGIVTMRFVGNGFRRYMVRLISGALIQVGSHWRTKEFVEDLLNSKGKKKCLFKAKPEGLYLQEVYYEEDD